MALLPDRATLRKRFLAEWPQIVRIVIAAVVSWEVCQLIDTSAVPIFAVVAPLVAMRDQTFKAKVVSLVLANRHRLSRSRGTCSCDSGARAVRLCIRLSSPAGVDSRRG